MKKNNKNFLFYTLRAYFLKLLTPPALAHKFKFATFVSTVM